MNDTLNIFQVRDLGEIISAVISFVRSRFSRYVKVILYTAGPFALLSGILGLWLQRDIFDISTLGTDPFAMFTDFRYWMSMVAGLVYMVVLIAAVYAFVLIEREEEATVESVWARIIEDLGIHITTGLASFALFLLSMVIVIIPCLGILLWIPLILYVMTLTTIAWSARLVERSGLVEAFSDAHALMREDLVNSILVIFVLMIIVFLFSLVLALPAVIVSMIWAFSSVSGGELASPPFWVSIWSLVANLITGLAYVVPVLGGLLLYGSLHEKSQGTGLQSRVDDWAKDSDDDVFFDSGPGNPGM